MSHSDGSSEPITSTLPESMTRQTERLRLVPVSSHHIDDLWLLHQEEGIARWFGGRWSWEDTATRAAAMERAWQLNGVGKWMAYHRETGALIGRGGCSRTTVDGEPCVEVGWAVRNAFVRQGYATEIGREGLAYAFDVLGVQEVLSFTVIENVASRMVMERLGMEHLKEIPAERLVAGTPGVTPGDRFTVYRMTAPSSR